MSCDYHDYWLEGEPCTCATTTSGQGGVVLTAPCPWCGARVEVGNTGLVVVMCTSKLTPYTRPHQTTGVVSHTHGLGWPAHKS